MKRREPVSNIMTTDVVTISVTSSLDEVEREMRSHGIRHMPVVSGEKLVGILSLTDLLRISFVDYYDEGESAVDTAVYNMLSISQVMVSNPTTVNKNATIREVAQLLSQREYHALPVIDGDKLVGIVTTTDLIKYLLDQY